MKKIILVFSILLISSACMAASVTTAVKGVVAARASAAACSQEIVNQSTSIVSGTVVTADYIGYSYTAGGTGTYTVSQLAVMLTKSGSPTGTGTVYLCPDDTGKPVANASCTSFGTFDVSTLLADGVAQSTVWQKFYNASGFSQTAGSLYWIKIYYDQDGTNRIIISYNNAGATGFYYSLNDSSWASVDTSSVVPHSIAKCAYATGETPVQGHWSDSSTYAIGHATRYKVAGSFTASENYCIKKVQIPLKKIDGGSLDGTVSVKLYASDGSTPPRPTGAALNTATETKTAANVTTSTVLYDFNFSTCTNLTSGTQYFVVIETDTLNDASNLFSTYHSGDGVNEFAGYTSSWSSLDSTAFMYFITYK